MSLWVRTTEAGVRCVGGEGHMKKLYRDCSRHGWGGRVLSFMFLVIYASGFYYCSRFGFIFLVEAFTLCRKQKPVLRSDRINYFEVTCGGDWRQGMMFPCQSQTVPQNCRRFYLHGEKKLATEYPFVSKLIKYSKLNVYCDRVQEHLSLSRNPPVCYCKPRSRRS